MCSHPKCVKRSVWRPAGERAYGFRYASHPLYEPIPQAPVAIRSGGLPQ
jgi:hypothetical protein